MGTEGPFQGRGAPRPAVKAQVAFVSLVILGKMMEARAGLVPPSLAESETPSSEPGVNTAFPPEDEARRASK